MKLIVLILLSVQILLADPTCPEGFQIESLGGNHFGCYIHNITLPESGDPRPYCHYLQIAGIIGYTWDMNIENSNYRCPKGLRLTKKENWGLAYCLSEFFSPPQNAYEECSTQLPEGTLGFEFDQN